MLTLVVLKPCQRLRNSAARVQSYSYATVWVDDDECVFQGVDVRAVRFAGAFEARTG